MIVNSSSEEFCQNSKSNESSQTLQNCQQRVNWKKEMRKMLSTKLLTKKPPPKLSQSTKSKNIPKNVSKAITQQILQGSYNHLISVDHKEFTRFIKKNKEIQNLSTLVKLIQPHKNNDVDHLHQCFRKICNYFIKKQYVCYIYNSKIKDSQWHLQYRNDLLKIFQEL